MNKTPRILWSISDSKTRWKAAKRARDQGESHENSPRFVGLKMSESHVGEKIFEHGMCVKKKTIEGSCSLLIKK